MVRRHLERLDSSFLSTLDAYIQGASDRGAADVAGKPSACGLGRQVASPRADVS